MTFFASNALLKWLQHERFIYFTPFVLLTLAIAVKLTQPACYVQLIQEDGFLETLQLLFFALTTGTAAWVVRLFLQQQRVFAAILWSMFALACFFICMEEISWGQRLLPVTATVDKSINLQGETNLHNHKHLQLWFALAYLLIGLVGSAGIRLFKKPTWLLPAPALVWYFLPVFLFNLHMFIGAGLASDYGVSWLVPSRELIYPQQLLFKDQEVIEVLLALGFFLHAAWVANKLLIKD